MSATETARQFVPALIQQGFRAELFPAPLPNGYGHKIALSDNYAAELGAVIVYHGRKGARYVTSELKSATPDVLARIDQAWLSIGHVLTPGAHPITPDPSLAVPSGTIELWVDGACLHEPEGLKFGWACVIRQDGQEHYRHSSSEIHPYMAEHRNVAAELQAVLHGLEQCRWRGYTAVTVYYDYAGIEQWAIGRWKINTRTTQDYARFFSDCPLAITWRKVPAHSGIAMNELVDQLATAAARASIERYPLP
jgi:ribonuclease H-related protein